MKSYLIQVAYTPEAWKTMVASPQNRQELVTPAVEALGGKMHQFWLSFGEYDLVGVIEFPDDVDAAAFSLTASAGGAVKGLKTTPLLTMEEGMEAMRKASKAGYKPPKS